MEALSAAVEAGSPPGKKWALLLSSDLAAHP